MDPREACGVGPRQQVTSPDPSYARTGMSAVCHDLALWWRPACVRATFFTALAEF